MTRQPRRRYRRSWRFEGKMVPVPLPPERKAAYLAAWRMIFNLVRKSA